MLSAKTPVKRDALPTSLGLLRFVPSLYQVALLAIMGAIFIVALAPRLDTDFWWHLKDGQFIALHHYVPSRDFMSYTLTGHAWTDHEWLAELGMYGLYRLAGLWGPIFFFAVVICATFALVYAQMIGRNVNRVVALFMVAASFVASSASWGPRIQMLTLFFLAAFTYLLHQFGVSRDRRLLIALPLLMVLWANVHGGFVLGLAIIVITLMGEWLNRVTQHPEAWTEGDLRALGIALVITGMATMVNPNGFRQLLYPLTFVLPNAYTNLIEESASPNFHMPVMMLFEAMLLLLVAAAFMGRPRLNWTHLFLVVAFTHLALSQVRNVAIWAVIISPLVAFYLQGCIPVLKSQFPRFSYRRRPVSGRIAPILNGVLLALMLVAYLVEAVHFVNPTVLRQTEGENYPKAAVTYLQKHSLPNHVFVSYGWGGYLLWNTFPQYRDYMDSRADTLFTNNILAGYLRAYSAQPGWEQTLALNNVQIVLVERTAPLAQVLARDPRWYVAERDPLAVLFVQKHV